MQSSINQIKASAGSGKTHTIINILLTLLLEQNKSIKDIFSSVLAITFTNAAASDMKDKLITRLKMIALGLEGDGSQKEKAKKSIEGLIENYMSLNMRTIDSFLLMLLKQNTLESHLPAQFDILFDKAEFFDPLLDELAYAALDKKNKKGIEAHEIYEENPELESLLLYYERMYEALFYNIMQKGFLGINQIRKTLYEVLNLMTHLELSQRNILSKPEDIKARYNNYLEDFTNNINLLNTKIEARKNSEKNKGNKEITLAPYRKAELEFRKDKKLPSFFKANANELFLAIFNKKEIARLEETENKKEYQEYIQIIESVCESYKKTWLMYQALKYTAVSEFSKLIIELQPYQEFTKEKLLSDRISQILYSSFKDEEQFPHVLSRLPYKLDFLLIDEFQDTNTLQWNVIAYFVEEILSQGGEFTYVGDVKQAIYAWRGGDSSLFESILDKLNFQVTKKKLETNWRSAKNVVLFNNEVFLQFKDKNFTTEILNKICKNHSEIPLFAEELIKNYADVKQEISVKWENKTAGKVALYPIPSSQSNTVLYESLRPQFIEIIKQAQGKYQFSDMAVLVRDNIMCKTISQWLTEENIPVITEGSLEISSNFLVGQCLSLLEYLADASNTLALWHVVAFEGLFSNNTSHAGYDLLETKDWLEGQNKNFNLFDCLKEKSNELAQTLEELAHDAKNLNIYPLLCKIFEKTMLFERFPQESGFVGRFLELAFQANKRNISTIEDFLTYWNTDGYKEKIPMPENVNAVQIQTIHKSKGAEYKFVIVWNEKKDMPVDELKFYQLDDLSFFAPNSIYHQGYGNDLKVQAFEMINLFYVAFTRAKEELHVLYKEGKSSQTVSQLLLESIKEKSLYSEKSNSYIFNSCVDPSNQFEKKSEGNESSPNLVDSEKLQAYKPLIYKKLNLNLQNLKENLFSGITPQLRGNIIHLFFEKYFKISKFQEGLEKKIALNILSQQNLSKNEKMKLYDEIIDIYDWLKTYKDFETWKTFPLSEQNVLDNNARLYRCDLCVETEQSFIIIDFKTGKEYQSYAEQIKKYIKTISSITRYNSKEIKAFLVYVDERKIKEYGVDGEQH